MAPVKWTERWYMLGLVPTVTAALGYLLFLGSLFARLLLLNAAIGVGLITENVRNFKNTVALSVIPDELVLLLAYVASFTVLFIMILLLHQAFGRYKSAHAHGS